MRVFVTSFERIHGYFLRIKWVSCGLFTSILSSDNPAPSSDVPKAPWEGEEVRIQLRSSDFKIFTLSTPSSLASTLVSLPPLPRTCSFLSSFSVTLGSLPPLRGQPEAGCFVWVRGRATGTRLPISPGQLCGASSPSIKTRKYLSNQVKQKRVLLYFFQWMLEKYVQLSFIGHFV